MELCEDCDIVLEFGMVVLMELMIIIFDYLFGVGGYCEYDILVIEEIGNCNIIGFFYGFDYLIVKGKVKVV